MSKTTFSRRTLLAGAFTGGAVLLLGSGALTGCSVPGGSTAGGATPSGGAGGILPNYIPFTGVPADFPATELGTDPAFRKYPKDRAASVKGTPGAGETLVGMANIYLAAPPSANSNSYWAGLNKRLGLTLDMQMVPAADYATKFATTIAGNDLPDLMQMTSVPGLPQLLDKRFQRLEDYLAGDKVKEYPNLANLQTTQWAQTVFNGGLYGIPIPRSKVQFYSFIREDIFDAVGVSTEPKGIDELEETAKALTDPKQRRWAFGSWEHVKIYLQMMNQTPNGWSKDGDSFTHMYETDQFRQVIDDLTRFWEAGVIHPDTFSTTLQPKALFAAGTVAINAVDGMPGWTQYVNDGASNPDFRLGVMPIYDRDGTGLTPWHTGGGLYSFTSIKKQDDPDRVRTILRTLDWLAAPFGTEEYTYRLFGKEGADHAEETSGNFVMSAQGSANTAVPVRYLADAPYTIYQPGRPDDADVQNAYQTRIMKKTSVNAALGLFSETYLSKNTVIDKALVDGLKEIVQGRQPLKHLDTLVAGWRSGGGDAMRNEYEESAASA